MNIYVLTSEQQQVLEILNLEKETNRTEFQRIKNLFKSNEAITDTEMEEHKKSLKQLEKQRMKLERRICELFYTEEEKIEKKKEQGEQDKL